MERIKSAAALLCIRASSLCVDLALRLTPRPVAVTLLDEMDDDMDRALREADLLGRALGRVVG